MWHVWRIQRWGLDAGDFGDSRGRDRSDPEGLVADEQTVRALRTFGAEAIPRLAEEFSQTNECSSETEFRLENAAFALRIIATDIGAGAKGAVPALLKLLNNESRVSTLAFQTLGKIRSDPETVVPALLRFVNYPPRYTRGWQMEQHKQALLTLGEYGSAAKEAVPLILKAFDDPRGFCRKEALEALQKIDPEAAKNVGDKAEGK
jgi:HEAT repeat protein